MPASRSSMGEKLVVSLPLELQETEAVAERIGHPGQKAPGPFLDVPLETRAGRPGAGDRRLDVFDGQVEMDRCPVSTVVPRWHRPHEGRSPRPIRQKEDRRRGAEQLDGALTEAP